MCYAQVWRRDEMLEPSSGIVTLSWNYRIYDLFKVLLLYLSTKIYFFSQILDIVNQIPYTSRVIFSM